MDQVSGTLTSLTFYFFIFACASVFRGFGFASARILCSAQHKCVRAGPQQQFDGSGALYKTGFQRLKQVTKT